MTLQAAFTNSGTAFLVGAFHFLDNPRVAMYADAGNDVFDHRGESFAGLPGCVYAASDLYRDALPYDSGLEIGSDDTLLLPAPPFGRPVLLVLDGPITLASGNKPDAYLAWGSNSGAPLHNKLPVDGLEPRAVFATPAGIQGVLLSRGVRLDGMMHTTVTLVKASLGGRRGEQPVMRLASRKLHAAHQRQQSPRMAELPHEWNRLLMRATEGFGRHCKPYQLPQDEAAAVRERLAWYSETVQSYDTWQEALDSATTPDEFRVAVATWASRSGFGGTPYKQSRRMVEAYLAAQANGRKTQAEGWWRELKAELQPQP